MIGRVQFLRVYSNNLNVYHFLFYNMILAIFYKLGMSIQL